MMPFTERKSSARLGPASVAPILAYRDKSLITYCNDYAV